MKSDLAYLRHILDAIEKIERYASVGREAFLATHHWHDAVIREFEVIGEATKRMSAELRTRHGDVNWRRMAGLRDVLIHGYMDVDLAVLWKIVEHKLPELKRKVEMIIAAEQQGRIE